MVAAIVTKTLMAVGLAAGALAMIRADGAARAIEPARATVMRGGTVVSSNCADAVSSTTDACKDKRLEIVTITTNPDGSLSEMKSYHFCKNATEYDQVCTVANQANKKICQKEAKACSGKVWGQVTEPKLGPVFETMDACNITYTKATVVNQGANDPACVVAVAVP